MASRISPFLHPGPIATTDSLSIIHLRRDLQIPTILKDRDEDDEGYSEGKVVNTRFGSFPHKTLIGLPWGSQVRASKVDTGSRGRRAKGQVKKRRRDEPDVVDGANKKFKLGDEQGDTEASIQAAIGQDVNVVTASTGFIHLLPPTPENWTISLPHRTQVVYTPDYSYILHRLRARPGTSIIEAGAGSGSFTHASARAVYHGYPAAGTSEGSPRKKRKVGKVWSFEFHEQRHEKLAKEVQEHGLEGIVQVTHRDVCGDGFLVSGESPQANAIFLDLPAPWLALPHLSRSRPPRQVLDGISLEEKTSISSGDTPPNTPFVSPLNPSCPVHICSFSPCIEQVQRTISAMRHLGWVDISMVEISQKRVDILRQRVGIDNGAQRGLQTIPASVDEALQRLLEVEGNSRAFHANGERPAEKRSEKINPNNREKIIESLVENKIYKEGRLMHKTEQEVKTHTSYLVFAILPQEWSKEDEQNARAEWPIKIREGDCNNSGGDVQTVGLSKKQMKRAARQAIKDQTAASEMDKSSIEGDTDTNAVDLKLESPVNNP